MRGILALICIVVAAFCTFGFMATFEPLERSDQVTWRIVYATVGLVAIGGVVWAVCSGKRGGERGPE